MSRHRRGNSDLQGLKAMKNLTRSFHEEKQTVGRINRTFSNMDKSTSSSTGKGNNDRPEQSYKKYETNDLIINTHKLAKHFYSEDKSGFYQKIYLYLKSGWESGRKAFIEHLNKLPYVESAMQKCTYSEIEEEILKEWKKNSILYHIRALWYDNLRPMKFPSISTFIQYYNTFRDFIGQVLYLYFRGFFATLEKKGNDNIVDRLTQRTAHFVITNSANWSKIYERVLYPLLLQKLYGHNVGLSEVSLAKFDLSELELSPYAMDLSKLPEKQGNPSIATPLTHLEMSDIKLVAKSEKKSGNPESDTKIHKNSVNPSTPVAAKTSISNIPTSKSIKSSIKTIGTHREQLLPETCDKIQKFISEYKLLDKIKILISVRETLEAEIQSHQQKMIDAGHLKNYKVLDKDDFISCLIYCVVTSDAIQFDGLGVSIKYLHSVLGVDFSTVLSKFACDSYLADLEAVFGYLLQWKEKKWQECKDEYADVEIINYSDGGYRQRESILSSMASSSAGSENRVQDLNIGVGIRRKL